MALTPGESPVKQGLVLFAHGARDARWAEPFEAIRERVQALRPDVETRLAFLEVMQPDLAGAVGELVAMGCSTIRIAPVFFGQGGHVRNDLPRIADTVALQYPQARLTCLQPAGEDDSVRDAVAAFCVNGL